MPNPAIDRRCHWLRHNRSNKRPDAILFLDTESHIAHPDSRVEEHSFHLAVGCACVYDLFVGIEEREWRDLPSPEALWGWVEELSSENDTLMLVAHNMDYDARISRAFWFLPRLGWTPTFCVMSPSCTIFEWQRDDKKIVLLDNLNLFKVPLADLGQAVGINKIDVDFTQVDDDVLLEHCRADVAILVETWRWWLRFLDHNNLGDFGITVARQAFNAYRHRFMDCQIGIHNNAAAIDLERAAYRGARCECFRVGKLPEREYFKLDVNGLYAAMMKWYPYPRKLVKVIQNVRLDYLDQLLQDYLVIAEVVVEVVEPKYPVKVRETTAFPTGTFVTTLTTPELQQAIIANEIRGVGRVALYEPVDLFSGYIDFFTSLRQDAKAKGLYALDKLYKLLRNSLEGKFGQHGYKQSIIGDASIDAVSVRRWVNGETGDTCVDWTFGGKIIRQISTGEAFDSFPSIPAHVNAYGRIYMWSLIQMAGRDHVFYTDTDSLIVDRVGMDRLQGMIDPAKLGYLKVEGIATDVEIRARKDYRLGDREIVKGIKRNAQDLGGNTFDQWHFTTLRYAFLSKRLEDVTLHKVRKELKRSVTGGTLGTDGWITPPHLRMNTDDVRSLVLGDERDTTWTWEFDQSWLDYIARLDDINWRLKGALHWGEGSPPRQPLS